MFVINNQVIAHKTRGRGRYEANLFTRGSNPKPSPSFTGLQNQARDEPVDGKPTWKSTLDHFQ